MFKSASKCSTFNTVRYSGRNLATNVSNAAGQTGAAIFNNHTGLTITNNVRPAGNTAVLGTFFGEYSAARYRAAGSQAVLLTTQRTRAPTIG